MMSDSRILACFGILALSLLWLLIPDTYVIEHDLLCLGAVQLIGYAASAFDAD